MSRKSLWRVILYMVTIGLWLTACASSPVASPTRANPSTRLALTQAAPSSTPTTIITPGLPMSSTPPHLRLLGRIGPETPGFGPPPAFPDEAYGLARNLVITDDSHAYVIQGGSGSMQQSWGGLSILDLSEPSRPALIGQLRTKYSPTDLVVIGGATETVLFTEGHCEFGWASCVGTLYRVNVSDPAQPHVLASYTLNHLEDEEHNAGVLGTGSSWIATAIEASVDRAYVSGSAYGQRSGGVCGLRAFDTSDPEKIVPIGALRCRDDETAWAGMDLLLHGSVLYAAAGDAGLRVLDVSNPAMPTEIRELSGGAWGLAADTDNRLLYVAARTAGLMVYDIGNPASPVHLATVTIPDSVASVAHHNGYIALAGERGGAWLFKQTNLSQPVAVASYSGEDNSARGVLFVDDVILLVADLRQGVLIFEQLRK